MAAAPRFRTVLIDVDSTLAGVEGIDWLAERRGPDAAAAVAAMTDRAMQGEIALDAVYGERLALVRPGRDDLALFIRLANIPRPANAQATPLNVVAPAFMISELKRAFQIGFLVFLPFLVIDMIVASVLMSLGMMMLSPVLIALPFALFGCWRSGLGALACYAAASFWRIQWLALAATRHREA